MELCSIASGSSGNCIYAGTDHCHVLVDAGISGKRIEAGLNEIGLKTAEMDGILVTHEHSDHIKSLGVLARKYGLPMYATQGTIDACDNVNNVCIADGYQQYAKYISVMEYATHFNGITMNEKKFESLTPELQDVITKAAKKAALDCTKKLETKNAEQLEEMVAGGAEKTDNVDKAAFKEAAQSVYDKFLSNNEQGAKYYEAITALTAK